MSRLIALLCLSSALSLAGSWSGVLVDAKCYASEERNVNPTDTLTHVDRDQNSEIRYCSPRSKTRAFAVVQQDGAIYKLDSAGDLKAVELLRKTGKRSRFPVAITGEMSGSIIKVDSISVAR
jgi:hypothetical protein